MVSPSETEPQKCFNPNCDYVGPLKPLPTTPAIAKLKTPFF